MDYSYLAGISDGEGSFSIAWQINKSGFLNPKPFFSMGLKSDEREVKLLHSLSDEFGGNIYGYSCKKTSYVKWEVTKKEELVKIIQGIMPYQQLRKEESRLVLRALKVIEDDKERFLEGFAKETLLELADIMEKIRGYKPKKRKAKKWTYQRIKNYVDNSKVYAEQYKSARRKNLIKAGRETRFVEGRKLPEEIEKKRRLRARRANRLRAKYPDETVREARELHKIGMKVSQIAKRLNVNYYTMYDWLKRGKRR